MPSSKPEPRTDRPRRQPHESTFERDKSWRPTDADPEDETDGTVEGEMELDTERYERAAAKRRNEHDEE